MSDTKLQVTIQDVADIRNATIAALHGDFDSSAHEGLKEIEQKIQTAPENHRFIFDLGGLRFLNSYAIGQLVGWNNVLSPKKAKILIAGASKSVSEIFEILGITHLFELYPDLTSAIEAARHS